MTKLVTIHGVEWKLSDIQDAIDYVRLEQWSNKKWQPRPALVSRDKTSEYVGQKYKPEYTKLEENGWTHDHCEICWWTLHESEDPGDGEGYTTEDGRKWVCIECYLQFVK